MDPTSIKVKEERFSSQNSSPPVKTENKGTTLVNDVPPPEDHKEDTDDEDSYLEQPVFVAVEEESHYEHESEFDHLDLHEYGEETASHGNGAFRGNSIEALSRLSSIVRADFSRESSGSSSPQPHNVTSPSSVTPYLAQNYAESALFGQTQSTGLATKKKTFCCEFCGKSFFSNYNLVNHRRVHTGEKPYECSVCHSRFTQKGTLVVHMRAHSGERPFKCADCGKTFHRRWNYNVHLRSHSGERPYECKGCGKRFAYANGLLYHKQKHKH